MELLALLETLRSNYLLEFEAAYHQQIELNEQVFPEIAFEISGGVYKRLFVIDLVGKNGENSTAIEVGVANATHGGETSMQYNGLSIEFDSVSWDSMRFGLDPIPNDIIGFERWFDKWIDLDGERGVEGEFLASVIHSSTVDHGFVEVDFGSAPLDAVVELLDLYKANEVTTVRVSSGRK